MRARRESRNCAPMSNDPNPTRLRHKFANPPALGCTLPTAGSENMDAKTKAADRQDVSHGWRPERCDRVALVLQGGGALGAYQAGVYQALHEANIQPDWVSGVSIGAINSAIIAGNKPEDRLAKMKAFWERITDRRIWAYTPDGDIFRKARNA